MATMQGRPTLPEVHLPASARPGDRATLWLIARRAALESLRDRMTLGFNLFFALALPIGLVLTVVRWQAAAIRETGGELGPTLAVYLLSVGLMPATGAVGVASGQFAGEKEQGSLAPILASPASNLAIFGGKILGAVLPSIAFAVVAEVAYLGGLALVVGADAVRQLPVGLSVALAALVPAVAVFAATVASLVSSRVRTYNTAQQVGGLALVPFWGLVFGLTLRVQAWGLGALLAVVLGLVIADALLVAVAAATWRREEVLARR